MKTILPFIFMIIFLGIVVGSVIYLSKRMHFYFGTETIKYWYVFFAAMPVIMVAGMAIFSNSTSLAGSLVYRFAAITTGFILYFLMTVMVVDFVNLVFKIQPLILGVSAFVVAGIIVVVGIWSAFNIKMTRIEVPLPGLQKEVRAVHLSDIHIGHFRGENFLQKILDLSMEQQPEMIFITGDLFDGRINLSEEVLEPMKKLRVPVYFVEGNHDGYTGVDRIKDYLRKQGVHVLENETEMLGELQIVGLNHMHADGQTRNMHANGGSTIQGTLDTMAIDQTSPTILLHHSPEGAKYAAANGVDLYLAGHTHGGQIFPVTLLNEILFPYNRGMNKYEEMQVFVSEGVGTFGPPLRIGTKSEIVVLDLKPKSQ